MAHLPHPILLAALLLTHPAAAAETDKVRTEDLLAPREALPAKLSDLSKGWTKQASEESWRIAGPANAKSITVILKPATGDDWNIDDWNYACMDVRNEGPGLVRIEARLENAQAEDWRNAFPSSAVALPDESAVLGFPFTRDGGQYDGPELFKSMSARPDGFRTHWRGFDPAHVRQIRLVVRAASGPIRLRIGPPQCAWPRDPELRARLEALPLLDEFGQIRAVEWPGKVGSAEAMKASLRLEAATLRARPDAPDLDRFGGWKTGPRQTATGHFRTAKVDGRWWFVDPEGGLFWSMGVNSVGINASTPLTDHESLFAWVPPAESDLWRDAVTPMRDAKKFALNFPAANLSRALGPDWRAEIHDLTHLRMRAWGVNTMAAWSDDDLLKQGRTPYTLITGVWWPVWKIHGQHLPEPFDEHFEKSLRDSLRAFAWAKDDPFCIGVFIDNELDWPDTFGAAVLEAPEWQPTRVWALAQMQAKHPGLEKLEEEHRAELDDLYPAYAEKYFETCRRVLREELPGKLHLGCRTHRGPPLLGRVAARYVDVFSVNRYESVPGAHQVPPDVDLPMLMSEFHFGAPDRGVPGCGLRSVHDQTQRGRACATYVAGGLLDPRVVGAHWFCWIDQSAAGRPGENYQIGFVDVANRPHGEFILPVSRVARAMHRLRAAPPPSIDALLENVLKDEARHP